MPRRFPPPWTLEDVNSSCWIVSDANGVKLGYFYYDERQPADTARTPLTRAEAYAMAINFSRLPELLRKP